MQLKFLTLIFLCLSGAAHANLIDRGNGLIYDQDLNVTWLQYANFGAGSSYDNGSSATDGLMTWQNAKEWADTLSYGGYSDWRLPNIIDPGTPGCDPVVCGYNVDTSRSELAHLFFVELGNKSNSGLLNQGPFIDLQNAFYWSGMEWAGNADYAWFFDNSRGHQAVYNKNNPVYNSYAFAVRSGDVSAVPVPAAVWLFGSGLMGLLSIRRKRAFANIG